MKKVSISLIVLIALSLTGFSQQFSDRLETDCDGLQQSAHSILEDGKILFIVAAGFDCSICQNSAPAVKTYVDNNQEQMVFWGALSYLYNPNNESDCDAVINWEQTYQWEGLFNFSDSETYYWEAGLPNYIVVNPSDKVVVYQGGSFAQAQAAANALLQTTGIKNSRNEIENTLSIVSNNGKIKIKFNSFNSGQFTYKLYDITGKQISTKAVNYLSGANEMELANQITLNNGIYILNIKTGNSVISRKISLF